MNTSAKVAVVAFGGLGLVLLALMPELIRDLDLSSPDPMAPFKGFAIILFVALPMVAIALAFADSFRSKKLYNKGRFYMDLDSCNTSYIHPLENHAYPEYGIWLIATTFCSPNIVGEVRIERDQKWTIVKRGETIQVPFLATGRYQGWEITAQIVGEREVRFCYRRL